MNAAVVKCRVNFNMSPHRKEDTLNVFHSEDCITCT